MGIEDKIQFSILFLLILGIIIFGAYYIIDFTKHPEQYLNSCQISCKKVGYKYFHLTSSGIFGSDSCWCLKDNKPVRIW